MPDSVTESAPTPESPTQEAPATEPQTLDEWVSANPADDAGQTDLEADAQQPETGTAESTKPQVDPETAQLSDLREQLGQLVARIKQPQSTPQAAQPVAQAATQPQADGVGGDEWADAYEFLTDQETGLGYTPEGAKGFTKAMSGPLSAIERRIEAKLQRYEVLAAQYENTQKQAQEEALYKALASQPGGEGVYGASDKRNTEAIEMTRLSAALLQQMAHARGQKMTDEQAIAQAHKVQHFDKIAKAATKGTVPAVAANRTAKLAAQAAGGKSNTTNGKPSGVDERDRFLQNAANDPLTRKLGFVG